nr:MAG TPA: hypothetical protein [Bacteriophage sp.]
MRKFAPDRQDKLTRARIKTRELRGICAYISVKMRGKAGHG